MQKAAGTNERTNTDTLDPYDPYDPFSQGDWGEVWNENQTRIN